MEDDQTEAPARHKRQRFDRPPETDAIDDNATLKQCAERRAVLSEQLSSIADDIDAVRSQLENAEIESTTGTHTDVAWKQRATGALRYLHRNLDDHRRALRNLNGRIKLLEWREDQRYTAFTQAAKTFLPRDTYSQIWDLVDESAGAAE